MQFFLNNPALLVVAVLSLSNLVLVLILFWRFRGYRKIQRELVQGEEAPTIAAYNRNLRELAKILEELVENNKFNIQKTGIVRFNPFADTGGNMSFSIALLDGYDNGIVISSLHSREGTRIYAKPIESGGSKHNLTEEEREAIVQADNNR